MTRLTFPLSTSLPASLLLLAPALHAQEAAPPSAPASPDSPQISVTGEQIESANAQGLDRKGEILVVARRIKGQVQAEQPPIVTLDEEDIAAYGVSSIQELVAQLVPQTGTGRGRGDGTPVFLVNGLRISSFRELRGLPPEAIRRVEILPEEVALRYGFRPDQRVVNFILKDHFRSFGNETQASTPTRGGYAAFKDEATLARIDKSARTNITGTVQMQTAQKEASRGIVQPTPAGPDGVDPGQVRTLQPATKSAALNATVARSLTPGTALTLNALVQRDSSDALNGIKATEPLLALLSATRTTTVSAGAGLTTALGLWQLAATLDTSHVENDTATDTTLSPVPQGAHSVTDSLTSLATFSGTPLALPAGATSLTVKAGYAWAGLASSDTRTQTAARLRRGEAQAGFSLDLPLTSRKDHVLGAIGDLSANLNAEAHSLSDFGSLFDYGGGLTWKPTAKLALSGTYIRTAAAPSLSSLAAPTTATPGVSIYDFARGQTVLATVITGGNRGLVRERQDDLKFGANWTLPFGGGYDTLVIEYFRNHSANATTAFPLLTGDVQTAYAGRITRDDTGRIVAIDETPITLAMTRSSRLRTSLNLAGLVGKPDPAVQQRRGRWGLGGPGGPGGPPPGGPPPGFGRGGPGFGARGPGGPGGPPPGGPPPSDGRGRWNLSLAYSLELTNVAQLVPGAALLDMLHGDALTGAGVARHTVQLDGGGFYRGFGVRFSGAFASGTHVNSSGAPGSTRLDFGSLATLDVRVFADLGRMPKLVGKVPLFKGARLSLAVDNLFDGQQKVTDATGQTPLRYQSGYLDPAGRVIKLEFRKQF